MEDKNEVIAKPLKVSAGKVKWLVGEIEEWVVEGLVGREAADTIIDRYKSAQAAGGRAKLVYIVGIMAALLLGTGVIMFFSANWDTIPRFGKLIIICAAVVGSYYAGWELKYRRDLEIIGEALLFLGTLLFGAGIYLVAQAFNIKSHFPNGVMLWMLGIVPLYLLIKSKPVLAEITVLFGIWIVWELVEVSGYGVPAEAWNGMLLKCFLGLGLFGALALMVYRMGGKANAGLLMIASMTWLTVLMVTVGEKYDTENAGHAMLIYFAYFLALGAFGAYHDLKEKLPEFGTVYQGFSLFGIGAFLYMWTFPELVEEIIGDESHIIFPAIAIVFLICTMVAGVKVMARAGDDEDSRPYQWQMGLYFAMGALVLLLLALFTKEHTQALVAVVANLTLLGFIVALVTIGSRGGRPQLINFGIRLFALDIITRYFDWFFDLLPKSLFFIVGGLVLLVGGIFLEKGRKKLVQEAKEAVQ